VLDRLTRLRTDPPGGRGTHSSAGFSLGKLAQRAARHRGCPCGASPRRRTVPVGDRVASNRRRFRRRSRDRRGGSRGGDSVAAPVTSATFQQNSPSGRERCGQPASLRTADRVVQRCVDGKPVRADAVVPADGVALARASRACSPSRQWHLALALETNEDLLDYMRAGTLPEPRLPAGPRELLRRVYTADWGPGGSEMAVVRDFGGKDASGVRRQRLVRIDELDQPCARVARGADRVHRAPIFRRHPGRGSCWRRKRDQPGR